ncbi:MAG: Holliday junction branch migration protein RuvA [Opitutia bacterium]
MIVTLEGKLIACTVLRAVVSCGGVGYEVSIPVTTAERLGKVGSTVTLHTHQVFREDSQSLYGFATAEERDFFALVVEKVSGIGPKTAMALFSRLSLPILTQAVATSDLALLSSCPGIGKKTAERLILDLRDKVSVGGTAAAPALPSGAAHASSAAGDAVAALVALGTKAADADKLVRGALAKLGPACTADQLVKAALGR